jgi:hypothetical protein
MQRLTLYAEQLQALPEGMSALTKLSYLASDAPAAVLQGLPPTVQVVSLVEEEEAG